MKLFAKVKLHHSLNQKNKKKKSKVILNSPQMETLWQLLMPDIAKEEATQKYNQEVNSRMNLWQADILMNKSK